MKRIFTILTIALTVTAAMSCEKYEDGKPSKDVRAEFSKMYPDAWDVEWERYGGDWVVSFETGRRPDGTDRKAFYDKNGNWIQTITDVLLSDVPQNIKNYLQESEYGQAQFEDNDAEFFHDFRFLSCIWVHLLKNRVFLKEPLIQPSLEISRGFRPTCFLPGLLPGRWQHWRKHLPITADS